MSQLHVLFKVGDASYVVPAEVVVQMETFHGATQIPGAPPHVAGVIQLRGKVIPVVDLRIRFGLPPVQRTLDSRVIVVKHEDRQVGLLVDSAREVLKLDPGQFGPPPQVVMEQAQGFVTAIAQAGSRLVVKIDFQKVIGADALPDEKEQQHGKEA